MSRQVTTLPVQEFPVADGNWDQTRAPIDRIILHTEVGFKTGTEATFDNSQSHVSAHYGVNQDGTIDHYVDEDNTAYHAGDYVMNQRSIGIEHEDLGKPNDPRPDILYSTSAKLVKDICEYYNIPIDRAHILKHSEVIPTGCPDALDVDKIVRMAGGVDQQSLIDQLRTDRDKNWNLYQGEVATNGQLTQKVSDQQKELEDRQNAINTLNGKITDLTTAMGKDAAEDHDMGIKILGFEHQVSDIISALGLSSASTPEQILAAIKALKTPHDEVVKNVIPILNALSDAAFYKRKPQNVSWFSWLFSLLTIKK